MLTKDWSQVTPGCCGRGGEMVLHFRLASSVSVSEKLIFYKSRFGYLQPHLKHATAYLLLIFLIITIGLEASQNMSCFE